MTLQQAGIREGSLVVLKALGSPDAAATPVSA